jgi:hypothetical protein
MNWQRAVVPPPKLLVLPPDAASLDEAHAAIEQWEYYSGKTADPTQRQTVEVMMAETSGGRWAARSTGREMPRQNGKGDELEIVEMWGLTQRGEAILHSAHELITVSSAHERMVALLNHRDLRNRIAKTLNGMGQQMIAMRNGAVILYRTRTNGGGRGLDDISRLVVDEAQHAKPEQLASATPILLANPNPQMNFAGTGGIAGVSDWWWQIRRRALSPDPGQFGYVGHTAEDVTLKADGTIHQAPIDPTDRAHWYTANPALHYDRAEEEFLEEQLKILGPALFAREHLGVWDPEPVATAGDIDPDNWADLADPKAGRGARAVFGVDVDADRLTHIAVAWHRPDDLVQVMLADTGVSPLNAPARLRDIAKTWRGPVMLAGPSMIFEGEVRDARPVTSSEFASACGRLEDLIAEHGLRHGNQPELNAAVQVARWRTFGTSGERSLQFAGAPTVGPLAAVIRALHGLLNGLGVPPASPTSAAAKGTATSTSTRSPTADLSTLSF